MITDFKFFENKNIYYKYMDIIDMSDYYNDGIVYLYFLERSLELEHFELKKTFFSGVEIRIKKKGDCEHCIDSYIKTYELEDKEYNIITPKDIEEKYDEELLFNVYQKLSYYVSSNNNIRDDDRENITIIYNIFKNMKKIETEISLNKFNI